jgi:hypothetical protein
MVTMSQQFFSFLSSPPSVIVTSISLLLLLILVVSIEASGSFGLAPVMLVMTPVTLFVASLTHVVTQILTQIVIATLLLLMLLLLLILLLLVRFVAVRDQAVGFGWLRESDSLKTF